MVSSWMVWLALLLVLLGAVTGLVGVRGRHAQDGPAGRRRAAVRRVANSAPLLTSPQVRRRVTRRRLLHAALALVLVVGAGAAGTVAGRPVERAERSEALASRDIVLCLDVSTSMLAVDTQVLDTFSSLLDSFQGERVALVAWNTTAQTIVPLTDDYTLLRGQFAEVRNALDFDPNWASAEAERTYYDTFSGTMDDSVHASSLAGDGLASCAFVFDHEAEDRSRSIVLATDNQVVDPDGLQIYSVGEAADLASDRQIRLFSLYGADSALLAAWGMQGSEPAAHDELEEVITSHDGRFYEVDDADAVDGIVKELNQDQAEILDASTEVVVTDTPGRAVTVLVLVGLALLGLVTWRRA